MSYRLQKRKRKCYFTRALFWSVMLNKHLRYAKTVGAKHFSTSAKLNKGLEEMFLDLAKRKTPWMFMYKF